MIPSKTATVIMLMLKLLIATSMLLAPVTSFGVVVPLPSVHSSSSSLKQSSVSISPPSQSSSYPSSTSYASLSSAAAATSSPRRKQRIKKKNTTKNQGSSNVVETKITSLEDYLNFIGEPTTNKKSGESDEPLLVIKFHASWCKTCQKFGLRFSQLGREYYNKRNGKKKNSSNGDVRFGSIEVSSNTELCKKLGVKKLPSIHFYKNGHHIDHFPCGPSKFPLLKALVERISTMSLQELLVEKQKKLRSNKEAKKKIVSFDKLLKELRIEVSKGTKGASASASSTATLASRKTRRRKLSLWRILPKRLRRQQIS